MEYKKSLECLSSLNPACDLAPRTPIPHAPSLPTDIHMTLHPCLGVFGDKERSGNRSGTGRVRVADNTTVPHRATCGPAMPAQCGEDTAQELEPDQDCVALGQSLNPSESLILSFFSNSV